MRGCKQKVAEWETMSIVGLPSSYDEAILLGSDYYFSCPCKRGHMVPRRTKLRDCPKCSQMRHRTTRKAITRLVVVFSMLVDLNKRTLGFRGVQDSLIDIDIGDYNDTRNEFEDEITSRCPFDE